MFDYPQLARDKKALEDKVTEYTNILAEEEDKVKGLAKTKAKQEAIIGDLEDQVKQGEKVYKHEDYVIFASNIQVFIHSIISVSLRMALN